MHKVWQVWERKKRKRTNNQEYGRECISNE